MDVLSIVLVMAYAIVFVGSLWGLSWPLRLRCFGVRVRYEDAEARRRWSSFIETMLSEGSIGVLRLKHRREGIEVIGTAFVCGGMLVTAAHVVREDGRWDSAYLPFAATVAGRRTVPLLHASWRRIRGRDVVMVPVVGMTSLRIANARECPLATMTCAPGLILWYRPFSGILRVSTATLAPAPAGLRLLEGKICFRVARSKDVGKGASGAPIIVRLSSGEYRVIGVHVGSLNDPRLGVAESLDAVEFAAFLHDEHS